MKIAGAKLLRCPGCFHGNFGSVISSKKKELLRKWGMRMKRLIMILLIMLVLCSAAGCSGAETGIVEEKEHSQEFPTTSAEEPVPSEAAYANDFPSAYRSVIEKYRAVKEGGICAVSVDDNGYAADHGYAVIDLDGDGIEELIIAGFVTDDFGLRPITELYTLTDGQPTLIATSAARSRFYLTVSHQIYNKGSSGVHNSASYIYRLEDGELVLEEGFLSKRDDEEKAIVWYYTTDEDYDFSNDTRVSTEEAKERIAEYERRTYLPPLTKMD